MEGRALRASRGSGQGMRLTDIPTEIKNQFKAKPVGHCIYCGSVDELSDEHVLAYSLGGLVLLPKASCKACRDLTSDFERRVTRGFMHYARIAGQMPTRRQKERPDSLPLKLLQADGYSILDVLVTEYPAILHMPVLAQAGILANRVSKPGVDLVGMENIAFGKWPIDAIRELGGTGMEVSTQPDLISFARMLAKTAYGWAVASLGPIPREEVPILPLIRGLAEDGSQWLGSAQVHTRH